jgi:hypothetical protein
MKIIKKKKSSQAKDQHKEYSSEKDRVFRLLASIFKKQGLEVRREQLKFGSGWRALSGLCAHDKKTVLFVDSRLPQDEQIELLFTKYRDLNMTLTPENISELPKKLQAKFLA